MEQYEIRIAAGPDAKRTVACLQASDHAAIRRARYLAKAWEEIQVWRAETCVYARAGADQPVARP